MFIDDGVHKGGGGMRGGGRPSVSLKDLFTYTLRKDDHMKSNIYYEDPFFFHSRYDF